MSLPPTPTPSTALTPASPDGQALASFQQWGPPIEARGGAGGGGGEKKTPWHRYIAAVIRFKWLIAGCFVIGVGAGVAATRLLSPQYEARATVLLATEQRGGGGANGPISSGQFLETAAWTDLFKAYRVVEPVVTKLGLYIHHADKDDDIFQHFGLADQYQAGEFFLNVASTGRQYTLTTKKGTVLEHGAPGDSIGLHLGMKWQPPRSAFKPGRKVVFSVSSLPDAANGLTNRATLNLPDMSNVLHISLDSWNPNEAANTLNTWLDQFLAVAAELKKQKNTQLTATIGDQLSIARDRLARAEKNLQAFQEASIRVSASAPTTNVPTGTPGSIGAVTGDPAVSTYLALRVEHDNLSHDVQAAQAVLTDMSIGKASPDGLLGIPSLMVGADNLRSAINDYNTKAAELRNLQQTYTDNYKGVIDAKRIVDNYYTVTIPQLANQSLQRLRAQDAIYAKQLGESERVVQDVPARTIDLMRLQREVTSAGELFTSLNKAYEDSRLAEASTIPDIEVVDRAGVPEAPSRNTAPRVLMMAVFGGLGAGLMLALLLDRLDQRFRHPEQASDELGLPIIGTVPSLPTPKQRKADPEISAQVIEAFRTIRLHIKEMFPADGPVQFTITSPGAGEGKSLVSSNLAMSFAESGQRTLLIDGDIRRGQLHETFGMRQSPGLLDYLLNHSALDEVLQETDYEGLTLVTCGTRRHRGPELLQSNALEAFMSAVRPFFDVIIVDSPPLGAGIDPFALAKATGALVVVLRVGRSDIKMAQARLQAMDRFVPVRHLGSILNDVRAAGAYRYYSYLYGYRLDEGELRAQVPSQVGGLIGRK
ncbi:MAG TPA: polysaccharide biosynthesis tyrosine autokinase [Gemmatimonadaceae bacterium]|nr:polysaccharide biosynthesis tyrosine autokinase [Gemmatimonadaceae bacterium]